MRHLAIRTVMFVAALGWSASVCAGPPIAGDYQTTDLGGPVSIGHYNEGWLPGGGAVEAGTTLNAASWDGTNLGTEWRYWCATEQVPGQLLVNTVNVQGNGNRTYMKTFAGPIWWHAPLMFPIELVSHCARVLSLSLRLFGNMAAGHILLAIIFLLMGLDGLFGWALSGSVAGILMGTPAGVVLMLFTTGFLLPLKILVAFLQAFIFCMLSMLYLAGAVADQALCVQSHDRSALPGR